MSSHAMGFPRTSDLFENMDLLQGRSDNAEYRVAGHVEQDHADDLEGLEISEHRPPKQWARKWY